MSEQNGDSGMGCMVAFMLLLLMAAVATTRDNMRKDREVMCAGLRALAVTWEDTTRVVLATKCPRYVEEE